MSEGNGSVEPVVGEVRVPATREAAFRRFTEELASWWPRATHSVTEDRCASVAIEAGVGGRVFETDENGATYEWGRVKVWAPPARFVVSWHPGQSADRAQEVEVTFTAEDDGTRVVLTHRGWEAIGPEARDTRDAYAGGWPGVLATYAESLGASNGEQA